MDLEIAFFSGSFSNYKWQVVNEQIAGGSTHPKMNITLNAPLSTHFCHNNFTSKRGHFMGNFNQYTAGSLEVNI